MKKSSARSRVDRLALELHKMRASALSMATRFGDRIMAEDVLQEAWLRSVESSTAPDEIADLPAWLMGIVRNVARDRLRSEQRRRQVELQLEWLANQGRGLFWNRLPEVALDERRTEILIRSAIARLSQSSRQAVELFYFGDYSVEETAQALGVSPNVVKARLFKARKKLRGWLELLANDSQVKNELTSRKSPFELIHGGLTSPYLYGWVKQAELETDYRIGFDRRRLLSGSGSAYILGRIGATGGRLLQRFVANELRGRRVHILAYLRVERIEHTAEMSLRIEQRGGTVERAVFVPRGPIRTGGWQELEVLADIPNDIAVLSLELLLLGGGQVWLDRVEMRRVDNLGLEATATEVVCRIRPVNLNFLDATGEGGISGWVRAGSRPRNYEVVVDTVGDQPSGRLSSLDSTASGYGALVQTFRAGSFAGKRLRLSAVVKTVDVSNRAAVFLRVAGMPRSVLLDNMYSRPIVGTNDFVRYALVSKVPFNAKTISLGLLLSGPGRAWIADIRLESVGCHCPSTAREMHSEAVLPPPHSAPVNLDFSK